MVKNTAELRRYDPLRCSIMTGAGAITHVGQCKEGDALALVGLGGVGLATVAQRSIGREEHHCGGFAGVED